MISRCDSKSSKRRQQGRQNYRRGHLAERLALFFLRVKGYRKIAVNYKNGRGSGAGEVDLIVRKGQTLVFIEVKQRQDLETAAFAVTSRQTRRIRRGAEAFLQQNPQYLEYDLRFDAVLFRRPFVLKHLQNVF